MTRSLSRLLAPMIAIIALGAGSVALAQTKCTDCGQVQSIRFVEEKGQSSGVGAVAGGVLGGVLGHQIGSGRGNTAATVAGAAGGALVGNEIEKNRNAGERVEVRVRLDSGARVTYTQESPRDFHNGDRVRVEDGRVFRG